MTHAVAAREIERLVSNLGPDARIQYEDEYPLLAGDEIVFSGLGFSMMTSIPGHVNDVWRRSNFIKVDEVIKSKYYVEFDSKGYATTRLMLLKDEARGELRAEFPELINALKSIRPVLATLCLLENHSVDEPCIWNLVWNFVAHKSCDIESIEWNIVDSIVGLDSLEWLFRQRDKVDESVSMMAAVEDALARIMAKEESVIPILPDASVRLKMDLWESISKGTKDLDRVICDIKNGKDRSGDRRARSFSELTDYVEFECKTKEIIPVCKITEEALKKRYYRAKYLYW